MARPPCLSLAAVIVTTVVDASLPAHTLPVRTLGHALLYGHTSADVHIDAAVTLRASPGTIATNRERVTVAWHGVPSPHASDWIGVYSSPSPAGVNFSATTPVKLQMAVDSPTHLGSGTGNLTFSLLAMRGDYIFAFFRGGAAAAETPGFIGPYQTAVAVSDMVVLTPALQDAPSQIHLALSGNDGESELHNDLRAPCSSLIANFRLDLNDCGNTVVVMWTTKTVGEPVVHWGPTTPVAG